LGRITIKYLGYLAERLGYREKAVDIERETRIIDIIELPEGADPSQLIFLVNGIPTKPESKVKPGDTVSVMPHISGGL